MSIKNYFRIEGDAAHIYLTQGKEAIIDLDDLERVLRYRWYARKEGNNFYVVSKTNSKNNKQINLHKFLTGYTSTDHKDHDGLDNRRSNLREVTQQENNFNTRKRPKPTTSRWKGVCYNKRYKNWRAQIQINGKQTHLGSFQNEEDATMTYNEAAILHFGEFAALNDNPLNHNPEFS